MRVRATWMIAGVGGLSAIASGAPTWQTVIKQGDSLGAAGTYSGYPTQVVVGSGGAVGILGSTNLDSDALLYTPTPGTSPTVVAAGTASAYGFDNLAITKNIQNRTRLAFVANSPSFPGVYEYDTNNSMAGAVQVSAGNISATPVTGGGTLPLQVNATGQLLFPSQISGSAGLTQATGNTPLGQTSSTLFNPTLSGYSLGAAAGASDRFVQNGDGTATAILTSATTTGVYTITSPSVLTPIYTAANTSTSPAPDQIIGSTHNGATGITVYETIADTNNAHPQLFLNNGTDHFLTLTDPGAIDLTGEVSPTGKVAVYLPNQTLNYLNGATQTSLATVASTSSPLTPLGSIPLTAQVSDPSNPSSHLIITNLQDALKTPMVNDSGTIVFDALVAPQGSSSTPNHALLEWQPGDPMPILLLEANVSTVQIVPSINSTVNSIFINSLESEMDFYKNALSDDGYLGVEVTYTNPDSTTGDAVIETSLTPVPEPASLGLITTAGMAVLARRRRRSSK